MIGVRDLGMRVASPATSNAWPSRRPPPARGGPGARGRRPALDAPPPARPLYVNTGFENAAALALYEGLGFVGWTTRSPSSRPPRRMSDAHTWSRRCAAACPARSSLPPCRARPAVGRRRATRQLAGRCRRTLPARPARPDIRGRARVRPPTSSSSSPPTCPRSWSPPRRPPRPRRRPPPRPRPPRPRRRPPCPGLPARTTAAGEHRPPTAPPTDTATTTDRSRRHRAGDDRPGARPPPATGAPTSPPRSG